MKYHAGKKLYELEAHRKYTARMNRLEVVTDLLKLMRKRILTSQIALGLKSVVRPQPIVRAAAYTTSSKWKLASRRAKT